MCPGHKLKIEYGFGVQQVKPAQDGEQFGLLIAANPLIKNPAMTAVLMPGPMTKVVRVGHGVAVRKGAP
ncbi:MAG TPA: hypothetical protein VII31_12495, partial [Caldimonas sp.]